MNLYNVNYVTSSSTTRHLVLAQNFEQATKIASAYAENAGLAIESVLLSDSNLEASVINLDALSSLNTVL